jgi:hypothetical protein
MTFRFLQRFTPADRRWALMTASALLVAAGPAAPPEARPTLLQLRPAVAGKSAVTLGERNWTTQNASRPWSIKVAKNRANTAVFEVRAGDHIGAATRNDRSEVLLASNDPTRIIPYDQDVWAAGSVAIQSDAISSDKVPVIISQVHDTPDEDEYKSKSPPFALRFQGKDLYLTVQGDLAARSSGNSRQQRLVRIPNVLRSALDAAPVFHHWVARLRFSRGAQGEVDFWWNGVRVYSGKNLIMGYNNAVGGYWKYGIYRSVSSSETLRVTHANVEFGGKSLLDRVSHPLPLQ